MVGIAEGWAGTMARQGTLVHNPNLDAQVPQVWGAYGENVGKGPSCSSLATAFFGSPEHQANILDADYSVIGVGVVTAANGQLYVTEDFAGLPSGATGGPVLPQPTGVPTTLPSPANPVVPAPTPVAPRPSQVAPVELAPTAGTQLGDPILAAPSPAARAAAPVPSPKAPAQKRGAPKVMIEAVSNITPAGAVVPISAPAHLPRQLGVFGADGEEDGVGFLQRLGNDVRQILSHVGKRTPHATVAPGPPSSSAEAQQ